MFKRKRNIILALALCGLLLPVLGSGKEPAREVMWRADFHKLFVEPDWHGTLTLWIGADEYDGTGTWVCTKFDLSKRGEVAHIFAAGTYTFPGLGSFDFSERSKVAPVFTETGWYGPYSGIERITGGTGAFENADGVFNIEGYTHASYIGGWHGCVYTGHGMIHGIELP